MLQTMRFIVIFEVNKINQSFQLVVNVQNEKIQAYTTF